MKKNEIKVGQSYMAKVTGSDAPVRIDAESPHGGWDAKNLVTGRKVRIKTAQRLHRQCTEADLASLKPIKSSKKAPGATTSPTAATVAKAPAKANEKTPAPKGRDVGQTGAKGAKPAKTPNPKKPKKISGLTAAFMVLVDADKELGVKKIIEIAAERGWWKSEAATPHATIYAAMIREIGTKGDKSRFRRGKKRGTFRAVCSPEQKLELFGKQA